MFTLAEKTGWSEEFILWELPLWRALAYQHCAMWEAGAWTIKPAPPPEQQLDALASMEIDDDAD
ncbi:MAG: hypothetical protein IAE97_07075 [Chthoniobacterales bacterium]|nr:hypothetical protein [Chthoniobacterales bacterium]